MFCTYLSSVLHSIVKKFAPSIWCAKHVSLFAQFCTVYCTLVRFITPTLAKLSFLYGLCKNSLCTACPACIQLFVDIHNFLSLLLTVPGLHQRQQHGRALQVQVADSLAAEFCKQEELGARRIPNSTAYILRHMDTLVQSQMGRLPQEAAQGAGEMVPRAPTGDEQGS